MVESNSIRSSNCLGDKRRSSERARILSAVLMGLLIALAWSSGVGIRVRAEFGDATAQRDLGAMYYWGTNGPRDYPTAAKWLRKAADQGDLSGKSLLGFMLLNGSGIPKDTAEARRLIESAAKAGWPYAEANLGGMYLKGIEVPKDYDEAFKWFSSAASKGNVAANHNLGLMYLGGSAFLRTATRHPTISVALEIWDRPQRSNWWPDKSSTEKGARVTLRAR